MLDADVNMFGSFNRTIVELKLEDPPLSDSFNRTIVGIKQSSRFQFIGRSFNRTIVELKLENPVPCWVYSA